MSKETLQRTMRSKVRVFEDGGIRLLRKGQKGLIHAIFSRFGLVLVLLVLQFGALFSLMRWFSNLLPHYLGGTLLVTAVMMVYLLNQDMNNSVRIPWLVVTALAPVLGVLLFCYTKEDVGHRMLKKRLLELEGQTRGQLALDQKASTALDADCPGAASLAQYLRGRGGGFPVYENTQVTYFPSGEAKFAALLPQLEQIARYRQRQADIAAWNAQSAVLKRGIAITPVKFGISFTATLFNQAGALVHVYTDGSVQVNHGGTEMGQGLHTKVAQIVADELGVPLHRVLVTASDTGKVPNASATAASSGTDLNGRAAQYAARHVRDNLAAFVCGLDGCGAGAIRFAGGQVISPKTVRNFDAVVKDAYANRIQLWSDGFYRTPKIHYDKATLTGRPFYYFSYGAACTEVVIDTLTGENRVLAVDILHDVGHSINPAIDIGQIEGGFVQGMGWLTTEQLVWNDKGYLATHAPSTYKIPATGDIPAHFKVDLWPEANREDNVGGSKAVGEPPFMLAISVYEALRNAVAAGRGGVDAAAQVVLTAPATAENVLRALGRLVD